jgi:MATE family multidrug resistance protein
LLSAIITITGDYLLIFGHLGFPELGIKGAAIATDISAAFSFIAYAVLIFNSSNNKRFGVLSGWRFDAALFRRLVKFGIPSGAQFFLDIAGFTVFIMLVGTLGMIPLAASNIAFSINTLAFMPMIGVGIAVSVLVGQNLGANNPESAQKSAWSGFHLALGYMVAIAALFMFVPDLFLNPFLSRNSEGNALQIKVIASTLLRFVAVYTIFDTFNMVFGSALKGAGDTRYVMISNMLLSLVLLVIPSYILLEVLHKGIFNAWYAATIYIIALAMNFLIRFIRGKWKEIRIIEEHPPTIPVCCPPEVPTVE